MMFSKSKTMILAGLMALLSLLVLAPAEASSGGSKDEAAAYPGYMALEPLVVNLASDRRTRYLKLDAQFYLDNSHDAELVKTHMPLIRDRMITLLGGRLPDQISSMEAREQLRVELLEKLRETMMHQTGVPAISAIYFTGFIIQ
jgi:flagellar protein FliL